MENPSSAVTDYGVPKANAYGIADPSTEFDAEEYNKLALHASQMSHTTAKVILHFPTISSLATTTPSATQTHWGNATGSSSTLYPTSVTRTATGAYTIVYPSTLQNERGVAETVSFVWANGAVSSATVYGHVQCAVSGATITLTVFDAAGAATDITNGTTITVWAG